MESVRSAAKEKGDKHYFTGKPCKHGHTAPRFTSIGKCMKCARIEAKQQYRAKKGPKVRFSRTWDTPSIIDAFRKVHADRYDYSHVDYVKKKLHVTVVCKKHGPFFITPDNHLHGKGCAKCADEQTGRRCIKSNQTFLAELAAVWGDTFDFSEVKYRGASAKVKVICRDHGPFFQTAWSLARGATGCTKCNHMKSQEEERLFRLLSIFTKAESRDRDLIKPFELDIVLPEHRLAVEYNGMWHHSHFDREDESNKKHKHFAKYKQCQEQGVRLITIFESEWLERRTPILRLLRNAIGKTKGRLQARKCELSKVTAAGARQFYDKYHPQGGAGKGEHYALLWKGKIVACMRFTFGNNDRGKGAAGASWTLSRYATRVTVAGGASRLFQAFVQEHRPKKVKSFSDNRYFEGGMYTQLGFVLEENVRPDYMVWSSKVGLRPKSHYQRRSLPRRLAEHGQQVDFDPKTDTRTEAEVTYAMGAGRIYDCGKKRWVWTSS
jgi:hypothetical protein